MNFMDIVFLLVHMIGIYLIALSIWELREGKNKKKYIVLVVTGLFLYLFLPNILSHTF
ncbi:hypothetical protein ACERII_21135 [Evansella sp. AB-rgal1]|uniref:hypothetical protein n=1 Tax=Evansella sp. AB-rgal1 TaxID=3242696 RepID=UPI00359D04E4